MSSDDDFSASDDDEFQDEINDSTDDEDEIDVQDITDIDTDVEEHRGTAIVSRDGTEWSEKPFRRGQSRNCDIMTKPPGLTKYSKNIRTKKDAFGLFIDDKVFEIVQKYTNIHGSSKYKSDWKDLTRDEFDAFNGLLLTMGFKKDTHIQLSKLWNSGGPFRCSIYAGTMSRERFKQILACLRFDDRTTRDYRRNEDKLAAIREITDVITRNCQNAYTVGQFVCIDERMAGFRGNCQFRTYLPSKPQKYGLKNWMLADCKNFYIKNFQLYTGKRGKTRETELGARVVKDLVKPLDKGRNCTMDNLFTTKKLAIELIKTKNMTICGTMNKIRKEIPVIMLPAKNRPVFSSKFLFTKDVTMASYVPKKNKAVVLLSSYHHSANIEDTEQKKPEIIDFYNNTKYAVDILDKVLSDNDCKRSTRRWTLRMYFDYLNYAAHNSFVIFNEKYNIENAIRLTYLEELSLELLENHVRKRAVGHLHESVRGDIDNIMSYLNEKSEEAEEISRPRNVNDNYRCTFCPSSKKRKTRQKCDICHSSVCKHCLKLICPKCNQ